MGRAGGLREDFHQRAEAVRGVERGEASERTSIKGLRPSGEWGGREASERTSIKGLRQPGEWGGREASERTSIKGLRQPGEWGGREASERTSIKGLRPSGEWGGRDASDRTSYYNQCMNNVYEHCHNIDCHKSITNLLVLYY